MGTHFRNEKMFCPNCGGTFELKLPMEISLAARKMKLFADLHKDCEPTWKEPECDLSQSVELKAYWWLKNGDVGMSSKTMWLYFMGFELGMTHYPSDPNDFRRCYKLLEVVPEWKDRLLELARLSPQWHKLVYNWDELTRMFEQNEQENWKNYKKIGMYEYMQSLIQICYKNSLKD